MDTVQGIYDAFARGDLETILAAMHPDVTVTQEAPLPWGGMYSGPAGVADFLGRLLAQVDVELEVGELIPAGEHIVQIGHTTGKALATGKKFHAREVHVWGFKDGLVSSYAVYIDVPRMLDALA